MLIILKPALTQTAYAGKLQDDHVRYFCYARKRAIRHRARRIRIHQRTKRRVRPRWEAMLHPYVGFWLQPIRPNIIVSIRRGISSRYDDHQTRTVLRSGPACYAYGLYAARANLKPVLLTGLAQGGQLMTTTDVDNWHTMLRVVQGPELMTRFPGAWERFISEIIFDPSIPPNWVNGRCLLIGDSAEYTCDSLTGHWLERCIGPPP